MKLPAEDGKMRLTDVADTEQLEELSIKLDVHDEQ